MRNVADFNVQVRVFPPQHGQKPGLFNARASVRGGFQHLFLRSVVGHALHGLLLALHQSVFHESGHDAGHRGILPQAFRNVRLRPEPLVIIGHAFVPHAHLVGGLVNDGENGGHAAHDALQPNHRDVRQISGVHDVYYFHAGHRNAAEPLKAVATRALQKVARFVQQGVQTLPQHVIRSIVVRLPVLQCLSEIRLHVHVGFRVKFAHHFTHAAANAVFHVSRNPTAFAHFAVQPHELGL